MAKIRPMTLTTPLGPDVLDLVSFTGQEGVSQLFHFQIEALAENGKEIAFDKLLGQKVTVQLVLPGGGKKRAFNGVCNRVGQGGSDERYTTYRLELVPQFWLLSRRSQSRIFQQMAVPDILKKVLDGLDVSFEIQGTFATRDYCVQYRETDFNFASRLMEEEGIYYFFKHSDGGHKMVVANTPQSHPDMPEQSKITYDAASGVVRPEGRITRWEKLQELRSGKSTLWDHCFELPHKHLEAEKTIVDSVAVGQVTHKLKVGGNDKLELFDWPGEYAQRYDGVAPGGGDRAADVQKIFEDNKRTVDIRMQQEATPSVVIHGAGYCRQLVSGHKFTLSVLPDDHKGKLLKAEGPYVVTSVGHFATQTEEGVGFHYQNTFQCLPLALPYRPARLTPKPVVQGTQTAVVVGPSGEEIFTDKYGRVKVQFHWDRQGKNDANSSCWVRVGTLWAGKQWGTIFIPRIGQEVLVAFEEGDPDRPIVVGSVYNAEQMPPFKLPDQKTRSGLRTRSTLKGTPENFNELRFEDKKDSEEIYFHAEKDFNRVVENNDTLKVGSNKAKDGSQTIEIWHNRTETVKTGDEKVTIEKGNRLVELDKGDDTHLLKVGNRLVELDKGNDTHLLKMGNRAVQLDMGNDSLLLKMGNQTTKLNLGASSTEAMQAIELKVGQNSIKIDQTGITLKGLMITIQGQVQVQVKGVMIQVSADAMLQMKGAITMIG